MALSKIDTAGLAADAVDNTILDLADDYALTGNNTLSGLTVVQSDLTQVTTGGSSGYFQIGGISIPSSGIWLVQSMLRIKWGSNTYFISAALSTGSGNGSGVFTDLRMLVERVSVNTFGNLGVSPSWCVDMPTGLDYSSGQTIYQQIYFDAGDASAANFNDGNGRPIIRAIKLKETTTTGTTITEEF